ncbi:hypothetical protein OAD67_03645 [bacterium]|nr:hypothetical protein [bacterium]
MEPPPQPDMAVGDGESQAREALRREVMGANRKRCPHGKVKQNCKVCSPAPMAKGEKRLQRV